MYNNPIVVDSLSGGSNIPRGIFDSVNRSSAHISSLFHISFKFDSWFNVSLLYSFHQNPRYSPFSDLLVYWIVQTDIVVDLWRSPCWIFIGYLYYSAFSFQRDLFSWS